MHRQLVGPANRMITPLHNPRDRLIDSVQTASQHGFSNQFDQGEAMSTWFASGCRPASLALAAALCFGTHVQAADDPTGVAKRPHLSGLSSS